METTVSNNHVTVSDRLLFWLGVMGASFFGYLLFFSYSIEDGAQGMRVIGQLSTAKVVRLRHAASLHWNERGDGTDIRLKDMLYTPPGTTAEVKLNSGKSVTLLPNSMVQFDEVTAEGVDLVLLEGESRGGIQMHSGSYNEKGTPAFRVLSYPKTTGLWKDLESVEEWEDAQEDLDRRWESLKSSSLALGKLEELVGIDKLVSSSRETVESNPGIEAPPVEEVNPVSIQLKNGSAKGTHYEVEVSHDPEFKTRDTFKTDQPKLDIPVSSEGKTYYRVRSISPNQTVVSDVKILDGVAEKEKADKVKAAKVKSQKAKAKANEKAKRTTAIDPNSSYLWQVSSDRRFSNVLKKGIRDVPACPLENLGLARALYYCRVRPLNSEVFLREYNLPVK